jgi:hypothetical protein
MKHISIVLTILFVATSLLPELAQACPNCKEAYMSDGQSPVSSGFNTSIVFMMIMPFVVMGGFALRLWLVQRRRQSGSTTG